MRFDREITEVHNILSISENRQNSWWKEKFAVFSTDPNIIPLGPVLVKRYAYSKYQQSLANEKIDVIQYYVEPELFIAEAFETRWVLGLFLRKSADDTVEKSDLVRMKIVRCEDAKVEPR